MVLLLKQMLTNVECWGRGFAGKLVRFEVKEAWGRDSKLVGESLMVGSSVNSVIYIKLLSCMLDSWATVALTSLCLIVAAPTRSCRVGWK